MTSETGLTYELLCQINAEPDSLNFTINSTIYNATQQFMQSLMYISELTVTEFGGTDIAVYCNWSVNGGNFANSSIIRGTCVMFYSSSLV